RHPYAIAEPCGRSYTTPYSTPIQAPYRRHTYALQAPYIRPTGAIHTPYRRHTYALQAPYIRPTGALQYALQAPYSTPYRRHTYALQYALQAPYIRHIIADYLRRSYVYQTPIDHTKPYKRLTVAPDGPPMLTY